MKYFLCGYYGYNNLGDDLMLQAIAKRIALFDHNSKIYVKCNDASGFDKGVRDKVEPVCLDAILVKERLKVLNWLIYLVRILGLLIKVDILIIGGGGIFIDKGRHSSSLFTLFLISIFSRIFRKKMYITGVGIDLLQHSTSRFYLKWILKCADSVYFRENYGYRLAKSLIKNNENKLFLTKDILYCNVDIGDGFVFAGSRAIGIALTDYYFEYEPSKDKRDSFVIEFSRFIKNIALAGTAIKFFIFQDKASGSDRKITEDILRISDRNALKFEVIDLRVADDLKDAYKGLSMIIGMRFHALVFSSIFSIPFIGINHEKKIEEICSDFSMPYIDINNVSAGNLYRQVNSLFASGKKPEVTREMIVMAEQNFDFLKDRMK